MARILHPYRRMKKKETIWELIKRLDEQAGIYNEHLGRANQYFDTAARETNKLLVRHQKDLHRTIVKLRSALKTFKRQQKPKTKKKTKRK